MALTLDTDFAQQAWDRFLGQFHGKPRLEAFVKALFPPYDAAEKALHAMMFARGLDTAQGAQLDGIGTIVGQTRTIAKSIFISFFGFQGQAAAKGFGKAPMYRHGEQFADSVLLDDANYRVMLKLKIALNNGHGTAEEIIAACKAIFGTARVILKDMGNATVFVFVGRILTVNDVLFSDAKAFIPKAAGVTVLMSEYDPTRVFGFSNQGYLGFGKGIMARLIPDVTP